MSRVSDLLNQCTEQRYQLRRAQCPSQPRGVRVSRVGTDTTNCVTFSAWLLSHAFGADFSLAQWRRWMVSSAALTVPRVPGWGPSVILEWGAGSTAPSAGPWLIQKFSARGGHSFIILDYHKPTGRVLTLESAGSLDGVGWGQIGPLRDRFHPGRDWHLEVTQTWSSRIDDVRAAHVVGLNITGVEDWLVSGDRC